MHIRITRTFAVAQREEVNSICINDKVGFQTNFTMKIYCKIRQNPIITFCLHNLALNPSKNKLFVESSHVRQSSYSVLASFPNTVFWFEFFISKHVGCIIFSSVCIRVVYIFLSSWRYSSVQINAIFEVVDPISSDAIISIKYKLKHPERLPLLYKDK